jgi:hypothetical protein
LAESLDHAEDKPLVKPQGNAAVAVVLAWLVPGLGHAYLKRWWRALAFCLLFAAALAIGYHLEGKLYRPVAGQPLSILGTVGSFGMGVPYLLLRFLWHYEGNIMGTGFEYGSAFLLTAGLMNWLLVFDAWDIARGYKE